MLVPEAGLRARQSALTRFCFRYRHGTHVIERWEYHVLIVLDDSTRA